jgi:hypothetical protein
MLCELIPMMPEPRLRPLVQRFEAMLLEIPVFAGVYGSSENEGIHEVGTLTIGARRTSPETGKSSERPPVFLASTPNRSQKKARADPCRPMRWPE